MKFKFIKPLFVLIIFLFFTSCNSKYSKIEKANWFIGDWENVSEEGSFREIWTKTNDSIFKGISIVVIENDTVFYEIVSLEQKKDSVFYNVLVKGQNKEEMVSFRMTSFANDKLVFENPKHDYPSKIVYSKITKDSIVAEIFGLKDGKKISESYPMNRKKNRFKMKKTSLIVIIFSLFLVHSCKKYDANGNEIKEYEELNKASFLLGEWEEQDSIGVLKETWTIVDDSTYSGKSYFIINEKDTIHRETIELMQEGEYLIFRTTKIGENKDEFVPYQLMGEKDSLLVFENPKIDYPKKISYRKINDTNIKVTISGSIQKKSSTDTYSLSKK